jgi:type IV pilus assembly protein PilA
MTTLCPACGNAVAADERFCRVCGRQLEGVPGASVPPAPGAPVVPAETSGKALASLIFGLFLFFFPFSVVAIILGHLSLSEIRKSAGRLKGHGMAVAGLVLGYAGVAFIPFILIIAAIAIPNLLRARMAANESSAVASVRSLITAEMTYASTHPDQGYTCSLPGLAQAGSIAGTLAQGQKNGYAFELSGCTAESTGRVEHYQVVAYPLRENQTGVRAFCSNESTVVRQDTTGSVQKCLENGTSLE